MPVDPTDGDPKLSLRLLGDPSLNYGGQPIRVVNRKLLCLLGCLAMSENRRESRERLVGLLWSESDEKHARGSLRQAMTAFRRICGELGFEGFLSDRLHVGLEAGSIRVDVDDVLERLGPENLHPALLEHEDLPSRLLLGCGEIDPAFRAWLSSQRNALRDRLLRGLTEGLRRAAPGRSGGEDAARAILRLDPTQEAAVRHLMECRALAGDISGALRAYNALYALLEDEHDMEPTPPTMALVARIKSGDFAAAPVPAPMRTPSASGSRYPPPDAGGYSEGLPPGFPARSIVGGAMGAAQASSTRAFGNTAGVHAVAAAGGIPMPLLLVEPFDLREDSHDARRLLDGFRHALIGALVRFREWRVAESTSPVAGGAPQPAFRVTPASSPGTPAAGASSSALMKSSDSGAGLHGQASADLADAEQRLAEAPSPAASTSPSSEVVAAAVMPGAAAPASGLAVFSGERFTIRGMAESLDESLILTLTIRDDASGVFIWSDRFALTYDRWAETQGRFLKLASIAITANLAAGRLRRLAEAPDLPPSLHDLWLRGQQLILEFSPNAWGEAERMLREIALSAPEFAPAWSSLAQLGNSAHMAHPGVMRSASHHRANVETAQRAVSLDPLDSRAQLALGWSLAFAGRWDQARLNFALAVQLNPNDPWTLTSAGQAQAFDGRHAEALRLSESAVEAAPLPYPARWGYHAGVRFFCGDDEGALDAARLAGSSHAYNGAWRAAALARLGREEEARAEGKALCDRLRERWAGDGKPTDEAITRWLLQLFPLRQETDWERLRAAFAGAGLTSPNAGFGDIAP